MPMVGDDVGGMLLEVVGREVEAGVVVETEKMVGLVLGMLTLVEGKCVVCDEEAIVEGSNCRVVDGDTEAQ